MYQVIEQWLAHYQYFVKRTDIGKYVHLVNDTHLLKNNWFKIIPSFIKDPMAKNTTEGTFVDIDPNISILWFKKQNKKVHDYF